MNKSHLELASHYRDCLQKHGDSVTGMDWPDEVQNRKRLSLMTEILIVDITNASEPLRLLDFACGTSHYYGYLKDQGIADRVRYTGVDINPDAIAIAREKYPENTYVCMDLLEGAEGIGAHDYVVINGLFTQKRSMSDAQMRQFLVDILTALFPYFSKGLAFNAMSGQVDYRKDGAFHLDLNWIAEVMAAKFSRNFIVRHDYGLYENTIFLLKNNSNDV